MSQDTAQNPRVPPKLLWAIITFGSIIVVVFSALVIRQETLPKPNLPTPSTELKISVIKDITVSTDLPDSTVEPVLYFVRQTVQPGLIPKEIMIRTFQKGNAVQGDTFLGTWNQDGKFLSLLAGLTKDNMRIQYMRLWATPAGSSVTNTQAQMLLKDHFSDAFLDQFTSWNCQATVSAETNEQKTECNTLQTTERGELAGFSVQAPFRLDPTPVNASPSADLILVSACTIPADTKTTYKAQRCL